MSHFKPSSRAKTVLLILDEAPATRGLLGRQLDLPTGRRRRRMIHGLLTTMQANGWVERLGGLYHITAAGRDALSFLRAGYAIGIEDQPRANVRIFTRPEREAA